MNPSFPFLALFSCLYGSTWSDYVVYDNLIHFGDEKCQNDRIYVTNKQFSNTNLVHTVLSTTNRSFERLQFFR